MSDGLFIDVKVDESVASDPAMAAKLAEVCPVDIFVDEDGRVGIAQSNLDECVLCRLCLEATPAGTVHVIKVYADGAEL